MSRRGGIVAGATRSGTVVGEFDLQPDPRILPMLGEINLDWWRCVAELVDNSIDGFLRAQREGTPIPDPRVSVSTLRSNDPNGSFLVQDNGPGMTPEMLEHAMRAGWTANDPMNYLGRFGMGFNIATARLGSVTEVTTTREGDHEIHGAVIDFDELRRQRHFKTAHLSFPKQDSNQHGTDVLVRKLKPEVRDWFSKQAHRNRVEEALSEAYSSMLRPNGQPMSFELRFNGMEVHGLNHCVWGGPESEPRQVTFPRLGTVNALQIVDVRLPDRSFCQRCWEWVPRNQDVCQVCGQSNDLQIRQRYVRGWLGIQRYLHNTEYGIDFIRNGRKIELGNKDLFVWSDGQRVEKEYPIDDPRDRGRIVGEIHIDHCRPLYTKDRFDRTDLAWEEMVRIVRGAGPLRPDRASELGFGENGSPLFRLFQAFRRSTPKPKVAGAWARLLAVPDNDQAEEFAEHFFAGEAEYQSDAKWFQLVEAADQQLLHQDEAGHPPAPVPGLGAEAAPVSAAPPEGPAPPRMPIPQLSREYVEDHTQRGWNIHAYTVQSGDPELPSGSAWSFRARAAGHYDFLVDENHDVFSSITLTPMDALLYEVASAAMDFQRGRPVGASLASILGDLRAKYAIASKLDLVVLAADANATLDRVANSLASHVSPDDSWALFTGLSPSDREFIQQKMAIRTIQDPQGSIRAGRFLSFAPRRSLLKFFRDHPDLFFDGRFWTLPFLSINYGSAAANEEARAEIVRTYSSLLSDAIWLSEQVGGEGEHASRARLLRSSAAVDLLESDSVAADPDR